MKTRADHIRRLENAERIYMRQIECENGVEVMERLLAEVRRKLVVLRRRQAQDERAP